MYKKIFVICLFLLLTILLPSPVAAAYNATPEYVFSLNVSGDEQVVNGVTYTGPLDGNSFRLHGYVSSPGYSNNFYYYPSENHSIPNNTGILSFFLRDYVYGAGDVLVPALKSYYYEYPNRFTPESLPGYLGSTVLSSSGIQSKDSKGRYYLQYVPNSLYYYDPAFSGFTYDLVYTAPDESRGRLGYWGAYESNILVIGRHDASFNVSAYRDVSANKVRISLSDFTDNVPLNLYVYDSGGNLFSKIFTTNSGVFELDMRVSSAYTINIGIQGEGRLHQMLVSDTTGIMDVAYVNIDPQEVTVGEAGTFTVTAYDVNYNELSGQRFTLTDNDNEAVLSAFNSFGGSDVHYIANSPGGATLTFQSVNNPGFSVQLYVSVLSAATPTSTTPTSTVTPTSTIPIGTPTTTATPLPTPTTITPDVTPTAPPGSEYPVPDIQVTRLGHNDRLDISLNGYQSTLTSWDSNNLILFYDSTSSDLTRIVPNGNDYSVLIRQNNISYTWNFTAASLSVTPTPTTALPYVTPTAPPGSEYPVPEVLTQRVGYDDIVNVRLNGYNSTVAAYDTDGLILILENTASDITRTIPNYNDYSVWVYQNNIGYTWNFTGTLGSSDLLFSEYFTQYSGPINPDTYSGHRLTCKLESVSLSPLVPAQKKYNLELTTGGVTSNILISKLTGPSRPYTDVLNTQATGTWTQRINVQTGAYYRAVITTGSVQNVFWWNESGLLDNDPVFVLNPGVPVTPTVTPYPTSSWTPYPTSTPFPTLSNNSTAWDLYQPISLSPLVIDFSRFKIPVSFSEAVSIPTRSEVVASLTNSDFAGFFVVSWWFGVVDWVIDSFMSVLSWVLDLVSMPFDFIYDVLNHLYRWYSSMILTIQGYLVFPQRILSAVFSMIPVPVQGIILLVMIIDAFFLFARLILDLRLDSDRKYRMGYKR